ncbi:hypothetical protein CIL05_09525 [Virgibacillus profundi]|uniref:Uncharacterized protein n=1 Tax=Virgibacillus profundi TaxID=2024555 RepID=A0A2A2IE16_9BACI|nr:hypothetical protein [Virgibacillus profundi]PAV29608.1 hypothetical protein CIL05_09525 [Virgibacillus profundi]PXY53780.1 hypothetical protein CIT14_09615 [Virgibacillus profundi]
MVILSKLIPISIIVLSFAVGITSFYIMSDLSKEQKKKQMEELISQLVNFVIFIWLGKIIWHLSVFIKDPLAILAYPSNSDSFYIAVLFIAGLLVYKSFRKQLNVLTFMESFLHVFLVASFLYEFIQFVWNNNPYAFGYLILLSVLLILYFLLSRRITGSLLIIVILIGWTLGMLILTSIQPFVTVFGYIMEAWFVGLFFVLSFAILIYKRRKGDVQ